VEDGGGNCVRCSKRKHSFWEDTIRDVLSHLREPRPWANKIVAIAQKAKAFDLPFNLHRAILLKAKPELFTKGLKIMCKKMETLVFLESVSFLPCPLRKLAKAFVLTASKSLYPHYCNTEENLNYIGPIPIVLYYGVNEVGEEEKREFLVWYESRKSEPFQNRSVLRMYCQMTSQS